MKSKLKYINIGCGDKWHKDWVNLDMHSRSPYVVECNMLNGIPYGDNEFEVVYHSEVLEHFQKENATIFIKECFRILKPNGVMRIVVPDLENIINEYHRLLQQNIQNPDPISVANYDWILLELYDQAVRNSNEGDMAKILSDDKIINEKYIIDRIGYVGRSILDYHRGHVKGKMKKGNVLQGIKKIITNKNVFKHMLLNVLLNKKEKEMMELGKFRLSGEIHYWMYDRFSLTRILSNCGFKHIEIKSPFESNIPWKVLPPKIAGKTESLRTGPLMLSKAFPFSLLFSLRVSPDSPGPIGSIPGTRPWNKTWGRTWRKIPLL